MRVLIGISLAFALLLAWQLTWSYLAAFALRFKLAALANVAPQTRARAIFLFGVAPFASACLFVCAVVLPAYFLFEPAHTNEVLTVKLALPALVSAWILFAAACGACRAHLKTRRLVKSWLARADEIEIANQRFYCIEHDLPLVVVAGILRPRVFVARQVVANLSRAELCAALAHEAAHVRGKDNLKRLTLDFCARLNCFPSFRSVIHEWAKNAEFAADSDAARNNDGGGTALDLSQALIKIARLFPTTQAQSLPFGGAYLVEPRAADITDRVRFLLAPAAKSQTAKSVLPRVYIFAAVVLLAAAAFITEFWLITHQTVETAMFWLQ